MILNINMIVYLPYTFYITYPQGSRKQWESNSVSCIFTGVCLWSYMCTYAHKFNWGNYFQQSC